LQGIPAAQGGIEFSGQLIQVQTQGSYFRTLAHGAAF
jgi:hypothetical protein